MKKNKLELVISNFRKKCPTFFCYLLFLFSILLFVVIILKQPQKNVTTYVYNTSYDIYKQKVSFPYEQYIYIDVDNVNAVNILLDDALEINKYKYMITLLNENNQKLFYHEFEKYDSSYMYMYFGNQKKSINKKYKLVIECPECQNVEMYVGTPLEKETVATDESFTLPITLNSQNFNSRLLWYPIFGILIGIILYPLAKEVDDGKKKK